MRNAFLIVGPTTFASRGNASANATRPVIPTEKCSKRQCIPKKKHESSRSDDSPPPKSDSEAESKKSGDAETPTASPPPVKRVRNHDGFYLRMGLGLGPLFGTMQYDVNATSTIFDSLGLSEQIELAAGGTVSPGVVIGGGFFGALSVSPMYSWTANGQDRRVSGGTVTTEVIGPFIDVYPKSTRGFHLQAALGPAGMAVSKGDAHRVCFPSPAGCSSINVPVADYSGMGFGLVGGVGYEAFVDDHWSLGAIARVLYTTASLSTGDSSLGSVHQSTFIPGLLFGATYQ